MKNAAQLLGAALVAGAPLAAPTRAQDSEPVEIERVRDSDDVSLDPSAAYLLVEGSGMVVSSFVKTPTDAERADWERQRQEELAEAIEDYPRDLRRYERDMEFWQARRTRRDPPQRPVEPTDETFAWPDLESRKVITIGPQNRFSRSDGESLWLYEVPPGEYTFYGLGLPGFNDCACMGSVRFDVAAGSITAVRVGYQQVDAQGNPVDAAPDGTDSTDLATRSTFYIDPPSPAAYDPRLPRERIRAAEFSPVSRMANWYGGTINRVMPIPGVIDYERDRVIDLRAEAAATAEADAAAAEAAALVEAEAAAVDAEAEVADEAEDDAGDAG